MDDRIRNEVQRGALWLLVLSGLFGALLFEVYGCGPMVPTAYYLQGQQQRQQMPAYYYAPPYNPYDNWPSNRDDALLREERAERAWAWSRSLGTTCNPNGMGGLRCF